ncbi:hypothetical protein AAMO2058_000016900 [Amorphochlora amoebiformis]
MSRFLPSVPPLAVRVVFYAIVSILVLKWDQVSLNFSEDRYDQVVLEGGWGANLGGGLRLDEGMGVEGRDCKIGVILIGKSDLGDKGQLYANRINQTLSSLSTSPKYKITVNAYISSNFPRDECKKPIHSVSLQTIADTIKSYIKGIVLTDSTPQEINYCFNKSRVPNDTILHRSRSLPKIPGLENLLKTTRGLRADAGSGPQWFRLKYAWDYLEEREIVQGISYDVVLKLRLDETPQPLSSTVMCDIVVDSRKGLKPRALYAMSDHAFWGPRNIFKISAKISDNLSWFLHKYKRSGSRPFGVSALLRSFLSAHPWTFQKFPKYWYKNKLATLWVPDTRENKNSEPWTSETIIKGIKYLYCQNKTYITPGETGAPKMLAGPLAAEVDQKGGLYAGEPAFIEWNHAHNISMCEFGGGMEWLEDKRGFKVEQPTYSGDQGCRMFDYSDICSVSR